MFLTGLIMNVLDSKVSDPPGTTDFFPNIKDNLTKLTWAHAVNNVSYLTDVLNGDLMMIEADIILGRLKDDPLGPLRPVMGHPPEDTSDLSLDSFLDRIHNFNMKSDAKKGVKLDFKSIEVFEQSLGIIKHVYVKVQYPLWINADILPGPIDSEVRPVDAKRFLHACGAFPAAELSVGWTTRYGGEMTEGAYTEEQVAAMREALETSEAPQPGTFPVRAGLAAHSLGLFLRLLGARPRSTVTVWSSRGDFVDIDMLRDFILTIGLDRVYLDVPEEVSSQLNL